jgi:ribose-phosphate pyrophosphokinase
MLARCGVSDLGSSHASSGRLLSAGKAALIFALDESRSLASAIAAQAGLAVAPLEERAFEAGEFKLRPLVPVRERTVFVVQSLAGTAGASVSYRLLRLLFLLFVLRDAGAARMVAVVPYLAFARKERRTQARDPVSSRYVAELLETTGLDRLVALDVHNPAAFDNAYRIPTDHLSAIPYFADHFARQHVGGSLTVASPDIGGIKRAQIFSERLAGRVSRDVDFAFVEKRRARGVVSTGQVIGDVQGHEVILLDDLCASGTTLSRAAAALRAAGAQRVHAAFTHAPYPAGLAALEKSGLFASIVLTNSIGSEPGASTVSHLTVLPIAPLLGAAIARMLRGDPLAPLLERWPPDVTD